MTLEDLGWRNFFSSQLADGEEGQPARVVAVHRDRVALEGVENPSSPLPADAVTIGDWVVVDTTTSHISRVLDRFSLFRRRSAGQSGEEQLIAANVDTMFVVTAADRDFNPARIERYLALAHEAGVFPVVVLTKIDLVDDAQSYVHEAAALAPGIVVEAVDARSPESLERLKPWCERGQTVTLLGSSGVGKSTLVNSLSGAAQNTQSVREDDQRGRHTTTARSLHHLPAGGMLVDTPGMRELGLLEARSGLDAVFAEITELAAHCRFADCEHGTEPGCAVQVAIDAGALDPERLRRYLKLLAEDRRNSETLFERRSRDKSQGKLYKSIQSGKRRQKKGDETG